MYEQSAALCTRHCAFDEQQLPLGVDAHDLQLLRGSLHRAQMPGHAFPREHATGILRHANGPRHVVRTGIPMTRAVGGKMMAFDNPGETLADGCASDIHHLADLEDIDADLAADLEIGKLIGIYAELTQHVTGFNACLG